MKKIFYMLMICLGFSTTMTSCLKHGYDELTNSSEKALTAVNYTYRFLYDDTVQKGLPNQEILKDRVCEVVFSKVSTPIEENGNKGFSTTIKHDPNSVRKSGPTGSVTTAQLYAEFKGLIAKDQLSKLWVYVTVPDASQVTPLNGAPALGTPGDFSKDQSYRVTAADGSFQDYILKTVKNF